MDPLQPLIHVVVVAALSLMYFMNVAATKFRGGWRLAVDVALMVVFFAGGIALLALVDTTVHGAKCDMLFMSAVCLGIMGTSKLLFLIIAPLYPS
ncbi:MAG: hypothetical protein V1723_03865 [Candidatus Uhrbacteria bacterium]